MSDARARGVLLGSFVADLGVVARIGAGSHGPNPQGSQLPMLYDAGRPRSVIRFRIWQPRMASPRCPPGLRALRPSPMIDLYRKKAFSTRACRWYPDSFCHRRRPSVATFVIVRSRAGDRRPRRDTFAVLSGGTTTVAPRVPPRRGVQAATARCQPQGHIAASNEGLVVRGPVRYAVLRFVRGMHLRLHPCSVPASVPRRSGQAVPPAQGLHATTPRTGGTTTRRGR